MKLLILKTVIPIAILSLMSTHSTIAMAGGIAGGGTDVHCGKRVSDYFKNSVKDIPGYDSFAEKVAEIATKLPRLAYEIKSAVENPQLKWIYLPTCANENQKLIFKTDQAIHFNPENNWMYVYKKFWDSKEFDLKTRGNSLVHEGLRILCKNDDKCTYGATLVLERDFETLSAEELQRKLVVETNADFENHIGPTPAQIDEVATLSRSLEQSLKAFVAENRRVDKLEEEVKKRHGDEFECDWAGGVFQCTKDTFLGAPDTDTNDRVESKAKTLLEKFFGDLCRKGNLLRHFPFVELVDSDSTTKYGHNDIRLHYFYNWDPDYGHFKDAKPLNMSIYTEKLLNQLATLSFAEKIKAQVSGENDSNLNDGVRLFCPKWE